EKANKLKPTDALAHLLLGRAFQNTNRTVQAIEQFHTALRLDPTVPLGHYHLGFAYASLGRNQDAIAEYEKELKRSADNPNVLFSPRRKRFSGRRSRLHYCGCISSAIQERS